MQMNLSHLAGRPLPAGPSRPFQALRPASKYRVLARTRGSRFFRSARDAPGRKGPQLFHLFEGNYDSDAKLGGMASQVTIWLVFRVGIPIPGRQLVLPDCEAGGLGPFHR